MPRELVRRPTREPLTFHGIVGAAPAMRALFERMLRAARSDATVLIRGESGTGKELVARALHAEGPRSDGPFRGVNCATFTPELLASELFGHVKGAFTGAVRDKAGVFEQAKGGTLFLDEIAELPLDLQARLLRVLQERRFVPVGGTSEVDADVRLISATNRGLRRLVRERRFREDLMYRVRVVVLYLPPLREREGDLELLTWHFIDAFNARGGRRVRALSPEAWAAMQAYPWPGNVRELQNNLEQAFVLGDGPVIELDELAPELRGVGDEIPVASASSRPDAPRTLEDIERERIVEAYRATGGRRQAMADRLGISRATLYRRLKAYGLL